jgi:hypothetical protein
MVRYFGFTHRKDESMQDSVLNSADIQGFDSYHWTPALQQRFLDRLATSGSVRIAASHVSMSPSAAYQLRRRPEGAAFSLGWAAAVLIARDRLADELLDRALYGIEESTERLSEVETHRSFTKRRRQDPRLGLAMLARLDRAVDTRAHAGEAMLAQIIAGDWSGFLSLFEIAADDQNAQGHGAALACWLAGRDNRANPLVALWKDTPIACEVAQFSADSEAAVEAEPTAADVAADMTIWRHEDIAEWRTNFPPPDDYVGSRKASSVTSPMNARSMPTKKRRGTRCTAPMSHRCGERAKSRAAPFSGCRRPPMIRRHRAKMR